MVQESPFYPCVPNATTINAGTISISADSGLGAAPGAPSAGHLTLNGGTLESTADFTLNSNRGIALGASNGIIDVNSGVNLTYGGIMAGSGTLTKVDSGTLTQIFPVPRIKAASVFPIPVENIPNAPEVHV